MKQQFGWSCECRDLWFGSYCQFCGTHDATNDTCYGDAPYPQGSLCRSEPSSFGELEFLGSRCDLVCVKQTNSRVLSSDALEVYDLMKEGAPLSVLACPDALCYACDSGSREALCVDGALKWKPVVSVIRCATHARSRAAGRARGVGLVIYEAIMRYVLAIRLVAV